MSFVGSMDRLRDGLKPFYLFTYRFLAFLIITGSLLFLLGWGWVILFFMFNNTWIAPTVLSPTSDKMLTFQQGYLGEHQSLGTLKVLRDQQARQLQTNKEQLATLREFAEDISGGNLLLKGKFTDVQASLKLQREMDAITRSNEENLARGLISRTEVVQASTYIQQFRNNTTDGKVSFVNLQQQMITLQFQMRAIADQINTGILTIEETDKSLAIAEASVNKLDASSYAHALNAGSNMAFVGYDNIHVAKVGAPVYNCYLMIIACYQVGTITHVYNDEQTVEFPLFNVKLSRTVKGIMVDVDVKDARAMQGSVLFAGSKPLLF